MHQNPSAPCFGEQVHFDYIPFGRVGPGTGRIGRAVGGKGTDGTAGTVEAGAAIGDRIPGVFRVDRAFRPGDEVNIGSSASACTNREARAMSPCCMHPCWYMCSDQQYAVHGCICLDSRQKRETGHRGCSSLNEANSARQAGIPQRRDNDEKSLMQHVYNRQMLEPNENNGNCT